MRLKFDDLPRSIRERIVELSRAPQDPRVLISTPGMTGGWFKYVTFVGGLAVIAFCINFLLERARARIHPIHDQEVFLGLAAGTFVALASIAAFVLSRLYPAPPYKTGSFALSSYLMRLSRGWVDLTPLSELGKPTIVTVLRNGSYSGSRLQLDGGWTFYFSSKQAVEQACGRLLASRDAFAKAVAAKDARSLSAIDPFSECTLSGQWVSPGGLDANEGPKSPAVPTPALLVQWVGALAAGGVVSKVAYFIFAAMNKGE